MTDLENIYVPQGHQTPILLLDTILLSRVTPLGHPGFCHPFGFQGCQRQTQFLGQDDFQTPYPTAWRSQCGLKFHLRSARAVNVAIFVFVGMLRYTGYFSVALKPMMKRECPQNVT